MVWLGFAIAAVLAVMLNFIKGRVAQQDRALQQLRSCLEESSQKIEQLAREVRKGDDLKKCLLDNRHGRLYSVLKHGDKMMVCRTDSSGVFSLEDPGERSSWAAHSRLSFEHHRGIEGRVAWIRVSDLNGKKNKGYGSCLVRELLGYAKAHGVALIEGHFTGFEDHECQRHFWRKHGFRLNLGKMGQWSHVNIRWWNPEILPFPDDFWADAWSIKSAKREPSGIAIANAASRIAG